MNTDCPKCKCENRDETISIENNPNLVTCQECRHHYFVIIKLIYKEAYKRTKDGYSMIKDNWERKLKYYD